MPRRITPEIEEFEKAESERVCRRILSHLRLSRNRVRQLLSPGTLARLNWTADEVRAAMLRNERARLASRLLVLESEIYGAR